MLRVDPINRIVALTLAAAFVGSGCMTLDTRNGADYKGPPTYSGVREDLDGIQAGFFNLSPEIMVLFTLDLPLCLALDTLLLPVTIPEQIKWSAARTEARQVEHDVPSVITPAAQDTQLKVAQRLWQQCVSFTSELRSKLTDCYAVDARVVIPDGSGGTRELKGAEYKEHLRKLLPERRNSTRAVTYIDEKFELQGDKVRVQAMRADSAIRERTPITFVLGPGADGEWRILEQIGEGIPETASAAR